MRTYSYSSKPCRQCGIIFLPIGSNNQFCCMSCRVWHHIKRGSENECWLWVGQTSRNGYGRLHNNKNPPVQAHKLVYTFTYGSIPDGLLVCHKCDNPSCCNPNHLFIGTPKDNMQDMIAKGRKIVCRGPANHFCKLSVESVRSIRNNSRDLQKDIASRFGVSRQAVSDIKTRKKWAWLD